jgi:hypothetical protein
LYYTTLSGLGVLLHIDVHLFNDLVPTFCQISSKALCPPLTPSMRQLASSKRITEAQKIG